MMSSAPTNIHYPLNQTDYLVGKGANGQDYILVDNTRLAYSRRNTKIYTLAPYTGTLPISFPTSGNTQVQFKIDPGQYDQIRMIIADIQLQNTGPAGSTVTPSPAWFLWDQLQIGINSSSAPALYLYPEADYERLQFFTDEQIKNLFAFNQLGLSSADYKSGVSLGQNQIVNYSVPLFNPFFDRLNVSSLGGSLYITFFLDPSPINTVSSGVLTMQSFNLRIIASSDPDNEMNILKLYQSLPAYLPFTYMTPYTYQQQLTAGTASDILLNQVIGKVACLTFTIVAAGTQTTRANNAMINFLPLSGTDTNLMTGFYDVLDDRKNTILGSGQLAERYGRSIVSLISGGNALSLQQPIIWIVFCDNPAQQLSSGDIIGWKNFDGTYFLRLIPGSTFTSGTYTININAYYYSSMIESNGILSRGF
jgi:hypothetical protein